MTGSRTTTAVVVCAYTEERWGDLLDGYRALQRQTLPPDEVVVVIDHNDALLRRARATLTAATVVPNRLERGLSGARNTGAAEASADLLLFLDDDAVPSDDWVQRSTTPFEDPSVIGVGGWAVPQWRGSTRPGWLPESFLWVVGCSYEGLPRHVAEIRNPIGATMALRRSSVLDAGGFTSGIGRVGKHPVGCEETELSIRMRRLSPGARILLEPAAVVHHRVTAERTTGRYFLRRCFWEGYSKALVARVVGTDGALSSERAYSTRVLPAAVARGVARAARHGDLDAGAQAAAVVAGFGTTAAGYAYGLLTAARGAGTPDQGAGARREQLPVACGEVELTRGQAGVPAPPPGAASLRLLLRSRGEVLGYATAPGGSAPRLEELERQLTPAARQRAESGESTPLAAVPADRRVTVAVCTRQRPRELERCLTSLTSLTYADLEVLVVDNAPRDDSTREVVQRVARVDPRVRYVREPAPGLSRARNRALREAEGDVLAFTDDDCRVDPLWVDALVRGFQRREDVGCVTGLVSTASLEDPVESWFEDRVSWSEVHPPALHARSSAPADEPLFPYAAGGFGTGANFAVDTRLLRRLGGFDEALGAGTPSRGGEDLDLFVRVLNAGAAIAQEPSAVVWHYHRADLAALRRQVYGYGSGLSAFYAKLLADPTTRTDVLKRVPAGAARLALLRERAARPGRVGDRPPRDLFARELSGMAAGPLLYWRGRRGAQR
ncbi:glycosyltransferase [Kineococcus terrestris]|uniref:glycosyltransferase n=1 Tax=Kineococcus terrestris TaxID=2044856 RepID=UPI0034DAC4F1